MPTEYLLHVISLQDIRWDSRIHSRLPDLYVVVRLGDVSKQTQVVKKSLTPSWDEALTFSSDPGADLTIELKHKSVWKSDPCVGCASIRPDELLLMCTESEATRQTPLFLRKKGSGTPAGTLHLRLEKTNLMSNVELDVKAANEDIQQLPKMEVGSTAITALTDDISQLNTGSGLYKTIGILFSRLDILVGFIDNVSKAHPFLAVAWQVTSVLYKEISNQIKADKKLVDLVRLVVEAFDFIHDTEALPDKCRSLDKAIIDLLKQTTECCFFVRHYIRHGFVGRLLDVGLSEKIDEFSSSFIMLKNELDSGIALHTAFVSAQIKDKVDAIYLQQRLSRLNPDTMNAFDRPLCLPGTRMEIQKQIIDWAVSDSDQNIFWLHGVAGSGKSTISTTIAEHFRGLHRLGAFLFFERGKSDPASVIRTMACELASSDPSIATQISAAIELSSGIGSASATNQFEELILKPLVASATDLRGPILVILDALDECGTIETRSSLMQLFDEELPKLPKNIRFLITSRRETDIEEALSNQPGFVLEIALDFASDDSQRDVLAYIQFEMTRRVKKKVTIPRDWPWDSNIALLAKAAAGLFIWASTAVKLVSLHKDDPFQKLKDLVSKLHLLKDFGLGALYTDVLRDCGITWESEISRTRFSQVLGLILLSRTPLSLFAIDGILGFPPEKSSRLVLSRLQCLLAYPSDDTSDTSDTPIHLFHASFSDYLLSPERSDDPWFIDIPAQMAYITSRCFIVMKNMLHFNMGNLESSFVPNNRVHGLEDRIKENIPSHLAYACLHWSQHLSGSHKSSLLQNELSEFAYRRLLYWFEVLSLLGKVNLGDRILRNALQWTGRSIDELSVFLADARNLLTMFSFPVSLCTPHIYTSMLPLTSKESTVAAHFLNGESSLVSVERIKERGSVPLLRLLRLDVGSFDKISNITFSSDCTQIALGFQKGDIYIWDPESGEMVSGPLKGHTSIVTSIAFSLDGARIISGSEDRMIRSWNPTSGESMSSPFEGHTDGIASVVFSPDGNYIASGSLEGTVIIWDFQHGSVISGPLRKHLDSVLAVDFSPDGARIVSGSGDGTLVLWDVESGQALFSFEGISEVFCAKFSPDGARIIAGGSNGAIGVWNILTRELVCEPIKGHQGSALCVNLSSDGSRIVSCSWDYTVRIWNTESGDPTSQRLIGHGGDVMSANFTLDGTRIMSGSINGEIGIWDVAEAESASGTSERRVLNILLVAYTPDGSRIISVYSNKVQIWDVQSGEAVSKRLHGNNGFIGCAALSSDGTRLALSFLNSIVGVCDIESGELESDPWWSTHGATISMCFSQDGTQLISCSRNEIIVWDATSGKILYGPFEREAYINSVTFSPDGKAMLLGLYDGTIEVCDLESSDTLSSRFKGHTNAILQLILSLCGTHLASVSLDKSIIIWDYESGQVVSTLYEQLSWESSISFSPDGLRIASGSLEDKTVKIWDVISGELICGPFTGHSGIINSVSFSPDGTSVVSGSQDGIVRTWDVTMGNFSSRLNEEQEKGRAINAPTSSSDHVDSSNWALDEDGWIHGGQDELLLWVPPTLRTTLWNARNTALYGGDFQTRLDFSNCAHGKRWRECFSPPQ